MSVEEVTYLGRRARVTTTYANQNQLGKRRVTVHWIDDASEENGGYPAGTTVTRVVTGDGTRGTLVVLEEPHIVDSEDEEGWAL